MTHRDPSSRTARFLMQGVSWVVLGLAGWWIPTPSHAGGTELLSDSSGGIVPLEGESRLEISGLEGTISLRVGRDGELRYMARTRDNRRAEVPVALWAEGTVLRLTTLDPVDPQEGASAGSTTPIILEVAVPPQLDVDAQLENTKFMAASLRSKLSVSGRKLSVDVRSMADTLELDLVESDVRVLSCEDDVTIEGEAIRGAVQKVEGVIELLLERSEIEVESSAQYLSADLEASVLKATTVRGEFRVLASGGSVELRDARPNIELELDETPFSMSDVAGQINIETNADVDFKDIRGRLTLNGYGGAIRGTNNAGETRLTTYGSEIVLESLEGPCTIHGDELKLSLKTIKGQLNVQATGSSVVIQQAEAPIEVSNDFGDITIENATQQVTVTSRDGSVKITELSGPLTLKADGERVDVSWSAMNRDQNSSIENESGEVRLTFPSTAGGRIDARSRYGQIESNSPGVRVSDDGTMAAGNLRGTTNPVVQVRAGGNLFLATHGAGKPPDPDS